MPQISVVIPTYKRPTLLRRAIESVLSQTFSDWELLVSDDEESAGESWAYLTDLAKADPRVRPIKNEAPHGQAFNMNNLLRNASGEWIKPLDDDDLLRPRCLESLAWAVSRQSGVAMASCRIATYVDGKLITDGLLPRTPLLQRIPQRYVHLGMYLQDSIGAGVPTQVMVHRTAIQKGAWFEKPPGIWSAVDALWSMQVLKHGDSLVLNAALCERHQGKHETITSAISAKALDEEFMILRNRQFPLIDPSLHPPSLEMIEQMLHLIRAVSRVRAGRYRDAAALALRARNLVAWRLAAEWLLRQAGVPSLSRVRRLTLFDGDLAAALGATKVD